LLLVDAGHAVEPQPDLHKHAERSDGRCWLILAAAEILADFLRTEPILHAS